MAKPGHFNRIASNLLQFLEDGFLCDTILVTNGKEFRAHSILLAAVSPVFREAFEANNTPGLRYVELTNYDSDTVEIALNYIYTGKLLLPEHFADQHRLTQLLANLDELGLQDGQFDLNIMFTSDLDDTETDLSPEKAESTRSVDLSTDKSSTILLSESSENATMVKVTQDEPSSEDTNKVKTKHCSGLTRNSNIHEATVISNNHDETDNTDNIESAGNIQDPVPSGVKIKFEDGSVLESTMTSLEEPEIQVMFADTGEQDLLPSGEGLTSTNCSIVDDKSLLSSGHYMAGKLAPGTMTAVAVDQQAETEIEGNVLKVETDQMERGIAEFCANFGQLEGELKTEAISGDQCKVINQGYYILIPTSQVMESNLDLPSNAELNAELKTKRFPCDICGKLLTKKAIKAHSLIHTGERPFKCTVCGKAFTLAANLLRHSRLHTGLKPHLCHLCGKSFIQKVTLQDHLAIHLSEKKFRCATCGKRFLKSKQLTQHNNEVHRIEGSLPQERNREDSSLLADPTKPVLCDFCGKSFASKFGLKQHVKLHSEEKPFRCSFCEKSFLTKQNLGQHMLNHTGEKPFICKTCGIAYKRKHLLKWHEHVHTGERPYICQICGKSFAYSCSLKVHTRTHTGERPYECKTCGTAYSQSNHLKVHMRTHTGEKPFVCEQCGKAYKNRLDLRLHSSKVHQVNITKSRSAATNNNWQ